uniref:Probable rRNA-processing protein EBP2 homolog (inferred by orthology to a C. elegans protein) n=1 Tax=Strongyloides venezuelensis TaxID=75913 RepID=A0A0K0FDC6_STRVS
MSTGKIYKIDEIKAKVEEMRNNSLPWIESMDVSVASDEIAMEDIDNDFKREMVFYNQAHASAQIAINKLQKLNIPVFRPPDYFAEMAKSKEHMDKIKNRLDEIKKHEELQKTIRRLREEKKFAAKIQKQRRVEQMEAKHKEKKERENEKKKLKSKLKAKK